METLGSACADKKRRAADSCPMRRRVSSLTLTLTKPRVPPRRSSTCRTGFLFARAGPPRWTLTTMSPRCSRRYCSIVGASPSSAWRRGMPTVSLMMTSATPVRMAKARASRLSQPAVEPGSLYRRTAAAADTRGLLGTSRRGVRALGTTRYSSWSRPVTEDVESSTGLVAGHRTSTREAKYCTRRPSTPSGFVADAFCCALMPWPFEIG